MPIQTSQITTSTNGDLLIEPNGTGNTKVKSVDVARVDGVATSDTPCGLAPDGTVKKVALSTLPELSVDNLASTDLIAVQKANGDFYYLAAEDLASAGVIDPPNNGDLTITPPPSSGTGTAGDPYILTPVTVSNSGGNAQTVEDFSLANGSKNGILHVTFTNNHSGRFLDKALVADAAGAIPAFKLNYLDNPNSTSGAVYTGTVRFGTASVYCQWAITQQAKSTIFKGADGTTGSPNASPESVACGIFGKGSATWADGSKTLSTTGDIQFRVGASGYGTSGSVADGNTVDVTFLQTAVDAAAEGATVTGSLVSSDNTYIQDFSMVKDISPTVALGSASNAAPSAVSTSSDVGVYNFNATAQVTAGTAGANEMTSIEVSIDSGAFAPLPVSIRPCQTIAVRGTTGAVAGTAYTANIKIGNTAAVYTATTAASVPAITKPVITSPVDSSTDISAPTNLVSSAYGPVNSPGPHTSSSWQVYEADPAAGKPITEPPDPAVYTSVVNSANDTTNLLSYPLDSELTGEKSYYSRVKYHDDGSTGSTISSDFSEWNEFSVAPLILPDTWISASATEDNFWMSVTYGIPSTGTYAGQGLFVAVSRDGTNRVMHSPDGITWTEATSATQAFWYSVTYGAPSTGTYAGQGLFVALAHEGSGRVMYSTDGITWTTGGGVLHAVSWWAITYGDGTFIAVATNGISRVAWSTDGINWAMAQDRESNRWLSVTHGIPSTGRFAGKSVFVAVSSDGDNRVMWSDHHGQGYWAKAGAPKQQWQGITYGDGKYVAVAGTGPIMYSTDAENWTLAEAVDGSHWASVTYGDGKFVAVGQTTVAGVMPSVMHSPDGINWTLAEAAEENIWNSVTYGNGKYVAVAKTGTNRVMYSFA